MTSAAKLARVWDRLGKAPVALLALNTDSAGTMCGVWIEVIETGPDAKQAFIEQEKFTHLYLNEVHWSDAKGKKLTLSALPTISR